MLLLQHWPVLTKLVWSHADQLTAPHLQQVVQHHKGLQHVELQLGHTAVLTPEGMRELASLPCLHTAIIADSTHVDVSVVEVLAACSSIGRIELRACGGITQEECDSIIGRHLQRLQLNITATPPPPMPPPAQEPAPEADVGEVVVDAQAAAAMVEEHIAAAEAALAAEMAAEHAEVMPGPHVVVEAQGVVHEGGGHALAGMMALGMQQ